MNEMNEMVKLPLAVLAGASLGVIFFGGLWWTVRKGMSSKQPAFWFLGSMLLRTAITVAGFYFISGGQWKRMLECLAGFVVSRFIVMRMTDAPIPASTTREAPHAP